MTPLAPPDGPYTRRHDSVPSSNPSRAKSPIERDFSPIKSPKSIKSPRTPGPSPSLSNLSIISPPHASAYRTHPTPIGVTTYFAQIPNQTFPQQEIPQGPYTRPVVQDHHTLGRRGHHGHPDTSRDSNSSSPSAHSQSLSLVHLPQLRTIDKNAFNVNPNDPFLGAATNSILNLQETAQTGTGSPGSAPASGSGVSSSAARFVGGFKGGIKKVFGFGNKHSNSEVSGASPGTSSFQPQLPTPVTISTPAPNSGATNSFSRPPTGSSQQHHSTAASAGTTSADPSLPLRGPSDAMMYSQRPLIPHPGFTPSPTPSPNQPVIIPPPRFHHQQTQGPGSSSMSSIPLVHPSSAPSPFSPHSRRPDLLAMSGSRAGSRQPSPTPAFPQAQVQGHTTPSGSPHPVPVTRSDISENFSRPVAVRPRRSGEYMQMEGMPGSSTSSSSPMAVDSDGGGGGLDRITPSSVMNLTAAAETIGGAINETGHHRTDAGGQSDYGHSYGRSSTIPPPGSFLAFWFRVKRWWNEVNEMPWVAEERVTRDYYPHKGQRAKARVRRRMMRERERERIMEREKVREEVRMREREGTVDESYLTEEPDLSIVSETYRTHSRRTSRARRTRSSEFSRGTDGATTATNTWTNSRTNTTRRRRRLPSIRPFSIWYRDAGMDADRQSHGLESDMTTTTYHRPSRRNRGRSRHSRPGTPEHEQSGTEMTSTSRSTTPPAHSRQYPVGTWPASAAVPMPMPMPIPVQVPASAPLQGLPAPPLPVIAGTGVGSRPGANADAGAEAGGGQMIPQQGMYLPFPVTIETSPEGTQILKDPRNGAKYVIPIMLGAPPFVNANGGAGYWGGGAGAGAVQRYEPGVEDKHRRDTTKRSRKERERRQEKERSDTTASATATSESVSASTSGEGRRERKVRRQRDRYAGGGGYVAYGSVAQQR